MEADCKYQNIMQDILEKVHQGEYPAGSRLPSENQMAKIYGASVPTVRRALSELVYKREIFRIKGNGTFVSTQEVTADNVPSTPARKRSGKTICFLMLVDRSDSSIMKMIRGAQAYLFDKGYSMTILCGEERAKSEADLMQECIQDNVGGVILFSANPDATIENIRLLYKKNIKVVMLDRGPKKLPYTLVSAYNLDGGYQMARYLLECDHRRIAFAANQTNLAAEIDRIRGYSMALEEAGIAFDESLVLTNTLEQVDELIEMVRSKKITAVQCVNDKVAMTVMRALEKEGYSVPRDISVAGFDGCDEAEYTYPRITTIIQPFEEMGRIAASKLLGLIAGKTSHTQVYVPVELAVKDSTAVLAPDTGA